MSAENKAVIRRLFQEVWNRGNLEVADQIVAPDYVNHTPQLAGLLPGVRGFKQQVSSVHTTQPRCLAYQHLGEAHPSWQELASPPGLPRLCFSLLPPWSGLQV